VEIGTTLKEELYLQQETEKKETSGSHSLKKRQHRLRSRIWSSKSHKKITL